MRAKVSTGRILLSIITLLVLFGFIAEAVAQVNTREFAGFRFGVGLGVVVDTGKNDRIDDAEVINGVVRVEKESGTTPRVMLETHYFFTPCFGKKYRDENENLIDRYGKILATKKLDKNNKEFFIETVDAEERVKKGYAPYDCTRFIGLEQGQYAIGPFIAIQPGVNEVIQAIGAGAMIGLKRAKELGSFNLGVGFVVEPSVKVLGSGIRENQRLPEGETQIRFRETPQGGLLIITSFSW